MKNVNEIVARLLGEDGKLPHWTFPGCYPFIYFDAHGNTLCPDCANQNDDFSEPLTGYDVFMEGITTCDHCSKTIESAYGDPSSEDC